MQGLPFRSEGNKLTMGLSISRDLLHRMGSSLEMKYTNDSICPFIPSPKLSRNKPNHKKQKKLYHYSFLIDLPVTFNVPVDGELYLQGVRDLSSVNVLYLEKQSYHAVTTQQSLKEMKITANVANVSTEALTLAEKSKDKINFCILSLESMEDPPNFMSSLRKIILPNTPVCLLVNVNQLLETKMMIEELSIFSVLVKPLRLDRLVKLLKGELSAADPIHQFSPLPSSPSVQFTNLAVLLCEDNLMNQKIAVRMLNNLGCDVQVASNGIQAIEKLQNEEFNVIFMDLHMVQETIFD